MRSTRGPSSWQRYLAEMRPFEVQRIELEEQAYLLARDQLLDGWTHPPRLVPCAPRYLPDGRVQRYRYDPEYTVHSATLWTERQGTVTYHSVEALDRDHGRH